MTVSIPPLIRRKRIPQAAIEDVAQQIARKFRPRKIILFGSYARGDYHPESDVDLLVVMETSLKPVRQEIEICHQIEYHFGLDVLVYTPQALAERIALGDSFVKDILKEGKVLYESVGQ
jgi:uncharacterized protein